MQFRYPILRMQHNARENKGGESKRHDKEGNTRQCRRLDNSAASKV